MSLKATDLIASGANSTLLNQSLSATKTMTANTFRILQTLSVIALLITSGAISACAQQQTAAPTVKQVDFAELKTIIKQSATAKRPLLVNFWATWCPPCREEFPDLVKIDNDYRGKNLDFVAVSLDDLADKDGDVVKFLTEMKATMPAYLLKTDDEEAAIKAVAPDWRGGLPFTILYDANGKAVYGKMGAVKPDVLRQEIEKTILQGSEKTSRVISPQNSLETNIRNFETLEDARQQAKEDAQGDISSGKLLMLSYGLPPKEAFEWEKILKNSYDIEGYNFGCVVFGKMKEYTNSYNEVSIAAIKQKFGDDVLEKTWKQVNKRNFPLPQY